MVSDLEKFIDRFKNYIDWVKLCGQTYLYVKSLCEYCRNTSVDNCSDIYKLIEASFTLDAIHDLGQDYLFQQLNPKSENFSMESPHKRYMDVLALLKDPKRIRDHYDFRSSVDSMYYRFYKHQLLNRVIKKMEEFIWAEGNPYGNDIVPCPNRNRGYECSSEKYVCPICDNFGWVVAPDIIKALELPPNDDLRIDKDTIKWARTWIKKHQKKTSKKSPKPRSPKRK